MKKFLILIFTLFFNSYFSINLNKKILKNSLIGSSVYLLINSILNKLILDKYKKIYEKKNEEEINKLFYNKMIKKEEKLYEDEFKEKFTELIYLFYLNKNDNNKENLSKILSDNIFNINSNNNFKIRKRELLITSYYSEIFEAIYFYLKDKEIYDNNNVNNDVINYIKEVFKKSISEDEEIGIY